MRQERATHGHGGGDKECAATYGLLAYDDNDRKVFLTRPVFRCRKCHKLRGYCQGAHDEHFHWCDFCVQKHHRKHPGCCDDGGARKAKP